MKWSTYNQSLVNRGEIPIGFDVIDNWDAELKEMNKGKVGEPFHYPNTFLLLLGYAKVYFHLPYRQTEGIAQGHAKGKVPSIPDYSTINRRINKWNIRIKDAEILEFKGDTLSFQRAVLVSRLQIEVCVLEINGISNKKGYYYKKNKHNMLQPKCVAEKIAEIIFKGHQYHNGQSVEIG